MGKSILEQALLQSWTAPFQIQEILCTFVNINKKLKYQQATNDHVKHPDPGFFW
jgi:hypothetical protein